MRILVLTSRVPWPLEKGDKLRIYHQLRHLHQNHEIILCCLSDQRINNETHEKLSELCDELHVFKLNRMKIALRLLFGMFSTKPFQVHYFFQKNVQRKIQSIIAQKNPDHIFCQLLRTSEYVKNIFEIPKTLDYMDAFSKGTQRRIRNAGFIERILLREEHKRLMAYENLIFDYFDNHCIISAQDREFIKHPKKKEIEVISNGIDAEYFQPNIADKKYDIVFTGNMNYPPNMEGAIYIVKKIMPHVWKIKPQSRVIIAGVNDSKKVYELANDKVEVTGWVDDIREAYNASKIFLAPMQIGTGLQNKLLEAMSMNLPCITSTLANNALNAEDGVEVLIGKDPEDYASKIIQLLDNEELASDIAKRGREFVHNNYDWSSSSKQLEKLITSK